MIELKVTSKEGCASYISADNQRDAKNTAKRCGGCYWLLSKEKPNIGKPGCYGMDVEQRSADVILIDTNPDSFVKLAECNITRATLPPVVREYKSRD